MPPPARTFEVPAVWHENVSLRSAGSGSAIIAGMKGPRSAQRMATILPVLTPTVLWTRYT